MIETLSQNKRKFIASLRQAKHRREMQLFVAEGGKCVGELAGIFHCRILAATASWLENNRGFGDEIYKASTADMERMTSFASAPEVIAVFEMPERPLDLAAMKQGLTLALDGIQDPGNLGTIIRTCDWFGVRNILCSRDTVDVYNPKVVQSTMGAIARVNIHYVDLPETVASLGLPVFGTFLDGDNIFNAELPADAVIVMGNEGKGITKEMAERVTRKLFIPPYPLEAQHVESLNVSIATAITIAQFRSIQ